MWWLPRSAPPLGQPMADVPNRTKGRRITRGRFGPATHTGDTNQLQAGGPPLLLRSTRRFDASIFATIAKRSRSTHFGALRFKLVAWRKRRFRCVASWFLLKCPEDAVTMKSCEPSVRSMRLRAAAAWRWTASCTTHYTVSRTLCRERCARSLQGQGVSLFSHFAGKPRPIADLICAWPSSMKHLSARGHPRLCAVSSRAAMGAESLAPR